MTSLSKHLTQSKGRRLCLLPGNSEMHWIEPGSACLGCHSTNFVQHLFPVPMATPLGQRGSLQSSQARKFSLAPSSDHIHHHCLFIMPDNGPRALLATYIGRDSTRILIFFWGGGCASFFEKRSNRGSSQEVIKMFKMCIKKQVKLWMPYPEHHFDFFDRALQTSLLNRVWSAKCRYGQSFKKPKLP